MLSSCHLEWEGQRRWAHLSFLLTSSPADALLQLRGRGCRFPWSAKGRQVCHSPVSHQSQHLNQILLSLGRNALQALWQMKGKNTLSPISCWNGHKPAGRHWHAPQHWHWEASRHVKNKCTAAQMSKALQPWCAPPRGCGGIAKRGLRKGCNIFFTLNLSQLHVLAVLQNKCQAKLLQMWLYIKYFNGTLWNVCNLRNSYSTFLWKRLTASSIRN